MRVPTLPPLVTSTSSLQVFSAVEHQPDAHSLAPHTPSGRAMLAPTNTQELCRVSLTRQHSYRAECVHSRDGNANATFGCVGDLATATVWVARGCRGYFHCNGHVVKCGLAARGSDPEQRCDCAARANVPGHAGIVHPSPPRSPSPAAPTALAVAPHEARRSGARQAGADCDVTLERCP